jgi:hypothetical protein
MFRHRGGFDLAFHQKIEAVARTVGHAAYHNLIPAEKSLQHVQRVGTDKIDAEIMRA